MKKTLIFVVTLVFTILLIFALDKFGVGKILIGLNKVISIGFFLFVLGWFISDFRKK